MLTAFTVRRSFLTLVACLVVVTFAGRSMADEAVQLMYKWTKGQVDRYRFTTQSDGATTTGMRSMKVSQRMVNVIRYTVQDVDADGTATIEMVNERLQIDMDNPLSKVNFDSADTQSTHADHPMVKSMLLALNEPFTVVMSSRGEIKDVKGMDKIIAKMDKEMPDLPPDAKKALSAEGFKDMLSQNGIVLPIKPVVVGDSWTRTSSATMPMVGTMRSTTTSTLKRTEQEPGLTLAQIESDVATERAKDDAASMASGVSVKLTEGKGTLSTSFDLANGRLLKQTGKRTLTINMTMPSPGSQTGATMTQQMTMTTTNELLGPEVPAAPASPPAKQASEKKQD